MRGLKRSVLNDPSLKLYILSLQNKSSAIIMSDVEFLLDTIFNPETWTYPIDKLAKWQSASHEDIKIAYHALRQSERLKKYLDKKGITLHYSREEQCIMSLRTGTYVHYERFLQKHPTPKQLNELRKALID